MTATPSRPSPASPASPVTPDRPRYIVVRPFNYGGVVLVEGTEFIPSGGKWDAHIINDPKRIRIAGVPPAPGTRR